MTVTMFIILSSAFATLTGLVVEVIKKFIPNDKNYNLTAIITGMVVGVLGTSVYYILCNIDFNVQNLVCALCMGLSCSLSAMLGYDKVKQLIEQLVGGK